MRAFAVVVAALAVGVSSAGASSFVVHATASMQQLGDFNITRDPTLRGVTRIYGPADSCAMRTWFALAAWRTAGFRLRLATLGGLSPRKTFCTDPKIWIDSAVVTGARWHTAKGLYVGDSFAKFHRLYPHARRFRNGWGITQVYRRCVIGICSAPYEWMPRLTAAFANGRVASFVFPVGAQGE